MQNFSYPPYGQHPLQGGVCNGVSMESGEVYDEISDPSYSCKA